MVWSIRNCFRTTSVEARRRIAALSLGDNKALRPGWTILNDHWIGSKNQYLCGNELTMADYFGAAIVSIGELVGCDYSTYPNIKRWLNTRG